MEKFLGFQDGISFFLELAQLLNPVLEYFYFLKKRVNIG